MNCIKKSLLVMLSLGIIFSSIPKACADETSELILKLLIKKGLISQSDVNALKAEVGKAKTKEIVKAEDPKDFRVYWKEGLRFKTADKKFDIKIGGRTYLDVAWMKTDGDLKNSVGKLKDPGEFRTARLYTSGTLYEHFIYKLQLDFAGGDADFKDVYVGMKHIPYLGTLKVGHFKEPFGLEELTSSRFMTFMERATPVVFSPGRNVGIGFNSTLFDKRLTWSAGVFRDANGFGDITANEYNLTARITALPWYEEKGRKLLHLGMAYSLRNPKQTLQYDERPEAHLAPNFVDTGAFPANYANLFGLEAAFVYGPFSLQGEFNQALINETGGPSDTYFEGFYAQASYFLTGEHRKYALSKGAFSRVKPFKNFSITGWKPGAWEVAARYSYLDLKDNNINGGIMGDITAGLNWYLNPNMRIMWNYIYSRRFGLGDANIVQTRFQVDF